MVSGAPLRIREPSGRSMPLMRVWAVNSMNRLPSGAASSSANSLRASSTMLLPSGVVSASEAIAAIRARSRSEVPPRGTHIVARRLPRVIVPVLSRSRVSTSPATSTALPLLAIRLAARARSMPAMPIAASRAPIVVGIRQTNSAIRVGMSSVMS